MGGIVFEGINNLYNRLNSFSKNRSKHPIASLGDILNIKESISLPEGRLFEAGIMFSDPFYSLWAGVVSEKVSDFSGYGNRFRNQLKLKNLPFKLHLSNPSRGYLSRPGENVFEYGISYYQDNSGGQLNLFNGMNGSVPRSLSNEENFCRSIEEMELLSNVLFYPYLKGKNFPKNSLYYLTLGF
jgi:hypothetical protein